MFFIGDVHGKTNQYENLIRTLPKDSQSIQVGDMGLGFAGVHLNNLSLRHRFIRGNHDNPAVCKEHSNWLGDFGYLHDQRIFYVAGAWSIDQKWRIEGKSWWKDEELSVLELNQAMEMYFYFKPDIMVTHEAPTIAAYKMLTEFDIPLFTGSNPTNVEKSVDYKAYKSDIGIVNTRTSQALQQMFDIYKPKYWIFGHYHRNKTFLIERTEFRCLDELSIVEIPTESYDGHKTV